MAWQGLTTGQNEFTILIIKMHPIKLLLDNIIYIYIYTNFQGEWVGLMGYSQVQWVIG